MGDNPHALSTGSGPPVLASGTLGPALERAAQRALACGALRPIETVQQTIEEGGIEFVIGSVSSLTRKALDQPRGARDAAPQPIRFCPSIRICSSPTSHQHTSRC